MNYKPRPGIAKVKLCGKDVLIPLREASEYCKTTLVLPTLWSATWNAFCRGSSIEKTVPVHVLFTKKNPEECRAKIQEFCCDLVEKGFFIEVPDDPEPKKEASENL